MNAALVTSFVAGPFAMFVHGREIEVPAGTRAQAKLAQDIDASRFAAQATASPTPDAATAPLATSSPPPANVDTNVSPTQE